MNTTVPLDAWISISALAAAEGEKPRSIRHAIYTGKLRHSRDGRSIRVRIVDWREYRTAHVVEPGVYVPDPIRSERALRAAERRARVRNPAVSDSAR